MAEDILSKLSQAATLIEQAQAAYQPGSKLLQLARTGLLGGLFSGDELEDILKRLDENSDEKSELSSELWKELKNDLNPAGQLAPRPDGHPTTIFIESGSTLAFFAGKIGDQYANEYPKERLAVLTNNFLASTALFGRLATSITSGTLRRAYLAYLPFATAQRSRQDAADKDSHLPSEVFNDRQRFTRLDEIVSSTDMIYMTASTFGFLIGPLVGTRDNAIFKYCLLNNRAHRPVRFCIAASKVFVSPEYFWERPPSRQIPNAAHNGPSENTVYHHLLKQCFAVFNVLRTDVTLPGATTLADHQAICDDRVRAADGWNKEGVCSAPSELLLQPARNRMFADCPPVMGVSNTWLNHLQTQPSGNIEIWIACRNKEQVRHMKTAAEEANAVLLSIGVRRKYVPAGSDEDKVLRLVVKSPESK